MQNLIKIIAILAIMGIVIVSTLLVLGVVDATETKDILLKTMLVLGVVALGGLGISFLAKPRE